MLYYNSSADHEKVIPISKAIEKRKWKRGRKRKRKKKGNRKRRREWKRKGERKRKRRMEGNRKWNRERKRNGKRNHMCKPITILVADITYGIPSREMYDHSRESGRASISVAFSQFGAV